MDSDDFQSQCQKARMFIEAMMCNGSIKLNCSSDRRCSHHSSPELSPIRKRSISPQDNRKGEIDVLLRERFKGNKINYSEVAERNAQELITEEEKEKIKAEKKKAKKERQRQKKLYKVIDLSDTNSSKNNKKDNIDYGSVNDENLTDNKEAEGLDVNAAFVSKAIKKVKNLTLSEESKAKKEENTVDSLINKALELEHEENLKEAIQYLSDALNLQPKRTDLLLKRSLLYFDLAKFEKSARDAYKVSLYSPKCPEAYYRLGEAHIALNNLSDAETAFTKLLTLDCNMEEVNNRLVQIRIKQLEEMGYHPNEAFTALIKSKNKTIDEAIEFLTNLENGKENTDDLYYSDEDESEEESEDEIKGASAPPQLVKSNIDIVINSSCPLLTDPSNIFECSSLFVGNLKRDITEKEVTDVFVRFGEIKSIKLTTLPTCYAFVNYIEADSAGRAMEALQGSQWLLSTVPLIIKFPHNVVNSLIPYLKNIELIKMKLDAIARNKAIKRSARHIVRPSYIKPVAALRAERAGFRPTPVHRKAVNMIDSEATSNFPVTKPAIENNQRAPPGTEECYFWRTTGCMYGKKCFKLHIPEHKGIALNVGKSFPPGLQC